MQLARVIRKFNWMLSRHQKIRIGQLAILMVLGGILETVTVSLMLPFMNAVMYPDETMNNKYVILICDIFGIESSRTFLILLALVLAVVYLLKNAYLMFEYNIQYRFVYGNMFRLQERMLSNFIHRPYEYFLQVNSGELVKIIYTDIPTSFNLLTTLLQLLTEIVVSGMLLTTVFVITPRLLIFVVIILLTLLSVISRLMKPVLKDAGEKTQNSAAGMSKWLLQSIQGIKEIKVLMKEEFFESKFNSYGKVYVQALRKSSTLPLIPRFFIEASSMSTMFLFVAILIYQGYSLESIIPMLSAVAIAALRLLPSVNRISAQLAAISYSEPMLDELIKNLNDISGKDKGAFPEKDTCENAATNKIEKIHSSIELSDITYCYPKTEKEILKDTGMKINKGESVGIIGSSGAGKTTAIDVMLGLLQPLKGTVSLDGINIQEDVPGFLKQIGYIPQMIFMLDGSIRANIAFGEKEISDDEVWRSLKEASLYDFVKSLPEGLDTQIGERGVRLSGGQRQRIGIARALYYNPEILVFDEATSALDNETEKTIMESIEHLKGQKTLIIIAHRLTTIEKCDIVFRVENGKIIKKTLH